jgi:predicted nucleic acid-binding protein
LIIVDTGPIVAAADADDHDHARRVEMFRAVHRLAESGVLSAGMPMLAATTPILRELR